MSPAAPWTAADIPDQSGKRALVIGVTSGIGERTVIELARHGAEVILGARDPAKLEASIRTIQEAVPGARLQPLSIDVSDLSSIRRAVSQVDGLEPQMATNHFGPFALTGLLLPQLVASGDGRVVAVGSQASRVARTPPLEDPRDESGHYGRWAGYAKSKLADLMLVFELDRRARVQGIPVKGLAAHPGCSATGSMGTGIDTGSHRERMRFTLMAATADLPGRRTSDPAASGR